MVAESKSIGLCGYAGRGSMYEAKYISRFYCNRETETVTNAKERKKDGKLDAESSGKITGAS